ncbi:MAG: CRISPR-associated protein Csc3 [Kamptonema sp. SIO1D9]|nr:CRISPR-associated protein Csc3 [Kamptonema sp. SIO1D9]
MSRLVNCQPKTLEERYFNEIRPTLYTRHGTHAQYGSRTGRSLAEHLDSACQFVLTVSKIAGVPEEKRECILAATATHDLNKFVNDGRNVKTLARDRAFLQDQLEQACVAKLIKTDEDLELVRRLIESHSGHNNTDGRRLVAEDPKVKDQVERWAAMLIGADLFDLGIEKKKRISIVETQLTVAFSRNSQLFEITLSEDRGYLTALLLGASREVLESCGLNTLVINPDGLIFEGESFPKSDLTSKIAKVWQKKIDRVFGNNVEQLVKATKDGIKVNSQAIQQNPEAALKQVDALLVKKFSSYKADKLARDIQKYSEDAGETAVNKAAELGLHPVSNADEFAFSEGMKAVYLSYREAELTPKEAWDKIGAYIKLSPEQRIALEPFNAQYGRSLFAAQIAKIQGMEVIQAALKDSFERRQTEDIDVSEDLVTAIQDLLNFPQARNFQGFSQLTAYIEANPRLRSSLGTTSTQVSELISNQMPPGTKVQSFSNRLPGGMTAEPKRRADDLSSLGYQLISVGANFPKSSKQDPLYLHFALPFGSSPELQVIWRKWLKEKADSNADGGTVTVDELQLYRDNIMAFKANKAVGAAFPKRPEFIQSTIVIPVIWGDVNSSLTLLKSLRLALELSLAPDFGFPFILGGNLEIEPKWDLFGRVEGIPSSLQPLLGNGQYYRDGQLSQKKRQQNLTAEKVLERLRCIGKLAVSVASLKKKDDALYDLAKSAQRPLEIYHVLLRWVLREQDEPNLEATWNRIKEPLTKLLESLMSEEHDRVSHYLKQAAVIAETARLRGSSFRRTAQAEPFSEFIKAVRSRKSHLDWDTVFASLVQQYHTRLDRIREYNVGATKYEQIQQFYTVLRQLFDEVYSSRPERLLSDSKTLEAAYLFFLQEARQEIKAQSQENSEEN